MAFKMYTWRTKTECMKADKLIHGKLNLHALDEQ